MVYAGGFYRCIGMPAEKYCIAGLLFSIVDTSMTPCLVKLKARIVIFLPSLGDVPRRMYARQPFRRSWAKS